MSFLAWVAAAGVLLTLTSLASGWIERLPITSFAVYLGVGVAIGPWGLGLLELDFLHDAPWLERLTEVALAIALFLGGLTLRVPRRADSWHVARRLAFPGMALAVGATAAAGHWLLGLAWAPALILGAMLAPTDPVLASTISVSDASDRDGLRVALSGEAGMNDGSAMPFLLLGMLLLTTPPSWPLVWHWALLHLLWGVAGGAAIGLALGWSVGKLSTRLALSDLSPGELLPLGLVALTYAAAQAAGTLGFIAAFSAGAGMRLVEVRVMRRHHHAEDPEGSGQQHLPPAELLPESQREHATAQVEDRDPVRAVGRLVSRTLTFGGVVDGLLAPLLVLLLGVALARHWAPEGVLVALLLFVLVRPLTTWIATIGSGIAWQRRLLLGWLGIRGIGTLNYLAYAVSHGLPSADGARLAGVAVTTVALSILLHGFTAEPLITWRRKAIERTGASAE